MTTTKNISETADREIVITRSFNAPRNLVFDVWTDPKHIGAWWGPTGFTTTTHEMNVKPGGVWRFIMHGPDGTDYPNRITYREVIKPEKLVFSHGDDIDSDPNAFLSTVTFKEVGKKTEITMEMVFNTKAQRDMVVEQYGAIEGNKQTMDRLEKYLGTIA